MTISATSAVAVPPRASAATRLAQLGQAASDRVADGLDLRDAERLPAGELVALRVAADELARRHARRRRSSASNISRPNSSGSIAEQLAERCDQRRGRGRSSSAS